MLLRFSLQVDLKYYAWQKELRGSSATILAEETRQVPPTFYALGGLALFVVMRSGHVHALRGVHTKAVVKQPFFLQPFFLGVCQLIQDMLSALLVLRLG